LQFGDARPQSRNLGSLIAHLALGSFRAIPFPSEHRA